MPKSNYDQAFSDHQFLFGIGPASDMTGGYVDQDDLAKMLASPTKATATKCLEDQIEYWFQVGPEDGRSLDALMLEFPEMAEIKERYSIK